jgi:hypothetical protein
MTIELSLRHRARQSHYFAIALFALAFTLLVCAYFSLPSIACKTLNSINRLETANQQTPISNLKDTIPSAQISYASLQALTLTTLVLGVSLVAFGCYLLGRAALREIESAERLRGIADAICICGDSLENLQKAVVLLVPKGQSNSGNENPSAIDLKLFADVLKMLK